MSDKPYVYFGHYEHLFTTKQEWFSPKEVGYMIGRSDQYVRDAFDNQKIKGHMFSGKSKNGKEARKSYQIHKDAVLLYLVETANYDPPDFIKCIKNLLKNRSKQQLCDVKECIDTLLAKKQ